jgi:hypothetical protein
MIHHFFQLGNAKPSSSGASSSVSSRRPSLPVSRRATFGRSFSFSFCMDVESGEAATLTSVIVASSELDVRSLNSFCWPGGAFRSVLRIVKLSYENSARMRWMYTGKLEARSTSDTSD